MGQSGPVVSESLALLPAAHAGLVESGLLELFPTSYSGLPLSEILELFPTEYSGTPLHDELEVGPSSFAGPVLSESLFIAPPLVQVPASGTPLSEVLDYLVQEVVFAGPVVSELLDVLPLNAPVIEDPTVVQRDGNLTFLADVNFRAWQNGGDKLTLVVEWQRGGVLGPWNLATPQTFDRRHDPEDPGGVIRPLPRRDLQGYWRFESDLLDSGEFPRDLTNVGVPPVFVPGVNGTAIRFDGDPLNYLQRGFDDPEFRLDGVGDFTLETWVSWNDVTGEQTILEKFTPPSGPGWSLSKLADQRLQFRYGGPPGLLIETLDPLASVDATFHQVVVRRRNKVMTVLFDGALVPLLATPPDPINSLIASVNPLTFGRRSNSTNALDADVDSTKLYQRALSNAEVAENYDGGLAKVLEGTATATPGTEFNFVWDVIKDLAEGDFEDVFVRISVSNNPTTSVVVGPVALSTTVETAEDNFARALQRRALAARSPDDFLGCGLLTPFRRSARDFENSCGKDLVASCVYQVLGTRAAVDGFPGDLQWRPDFGNKVWILKHRGNDAGLREEATAFVHEAMRWEPRVNVTEVNARANVEDPRKLDIQVSYRIIETNTLDNRVVLPEFEETFTI